MQFNTHARRRAFGATADSQIITVGEHYAVAGLTLLKTAQILTNAYGVKKWDVRTLLTLPLPYKTVVQAAKRLATALQLRYMENLNHGAIVSEQELSLLQPTIDKR